MGTIASRITSLTIVYSTVYSDRSKKTSKLRVTGLCVENSPVTGEFPAQMACNAKNVPIWWRHHVLYMCNVSPGILCGSDFQLYPSPDMVSGTNQNVKEIKVNATKVYSILTRPNNTPFFDRNISCMLSLANIALFKMANNFYLGRAIMVLTLRYHQNTYCRWPCRALFKTNEEHICLW